MARSGVIGTAGRGWVAVGALVAGLAGCTPPSSDDSTSEPLPPVGQGTNLILASAMVGLPAAMAASELPDPTSKGAELAGKFCAGMCHGIPAPTTHAATDWPVVLRRMWLRMERLDTAFAVPVPTSAERAVLADYYVVNALQVTSGILPAGPGKDLYVATCGKCHGLPDVRQHSPEDWVAVVRRMKGRMEGMLGQTLSQDQMQRIILYLESTSRRS
ncbi:MAG: cytochrome c [Gemmatimonadota bacterium]|nr:cytochrome c [Gemmatimonadota bacterium]